MPLYASLNKANEFRSNSTWQATHYGMLLMNFDPAAHISNSTPLTPAGQIWVLRLPRPETALLITNIVTWVITAGSGLTSGQCKAALYQGQQLVGSTADQSGTWNSTGLKTMALSGGPFWIGPQSAVDVVFWYNGTTGPALLRGASQSSNNLGQASPDFRTSKANTSITTTAPSSIGTETANSTIYWAGVS